jgi:peroxiredoxin
MRTRTVGILAVSLLLLAGPAWSSGARAADDGYDWQLHFAAKAEKAEAPDEPNRPAAANFKLADQTGKHVELNKLRGKVVVLEFLNPDCPFVKAHYDPNVRTMPKLAEKYADKGVVWLGINSTHYYNVEKNAAFHKKHDLPYPVLDDSAGDVGREYGAKTTPHLFIIAADGTVAYRGAIDNDPRGKKKDAVNHVDNALQAITVGQDVETPKTRSYGCSVKYAPKAKK